MRQRSTRHSVSWMSVASAYLYMQHNDNDDELSLMKHSWQTQQCVQCKEYILLSRTS